MARCFIDASKTVQVTPLDPIHHANNMTLCLVNQLLRQEAPELLPFTLEGWQAMLHSDDHHLCGVFAGGSLIGLTIMAPDPEDPGHPLMVTLQLVNTLHPDALTARTRLFRWLVVRTGQLGVRRLVLDQPQLRTLVGVN